MAGPLVGVGSDTFDGNGGVTTTATLSINGYIVPGDRNGHIRPTAIVKDCLFQ
jgi:hypothetical protein